MWLRLVVLALGGLQALHGDVCEGLPAGPPKGLDWDVFAEVPETLSFRLSVQPDGPAFRITVRRFSLEIFSGFQKNLTDELKAKIIHAGDIEVARCQDGKRMQLLPITAWQPLNFAASFHAEDINFDGYLDFSVLADYAAKFGSRSYWVYDPRSGLFVQNELTRELGENCLGAAWHGGCLKAAGIDFEPKKHEISTRYIWGCPGDTPAGDRYRLKDNRLIVIHEEVAKTAPSGVCALTVSDRIDGTMRVTEIRRFDAQGHRVR